MAVPLRFIGQTAMDNFFQDYRPNSGFFTLQDFILRAATTVSEFYQKSYDAQYQMNRQEKTDEVISFTSDILSEQDLKVEKKDGEMFATLLFPIMGFIHDKQSTGAQELIPISPNDTQLERSNITETWQYKLLPHTDRVFWRLQSDRIRFFRNGRCNINDVKLLYVPAVMDKYGNVIEDAMIADGVADMAINISVLKMKQVKDGIIIKKENDLNENKIMQTEINSEALAK